MITAVSSKIARRHALALVFNIPNAHSIQNTPSYTVSQTFQSSSNSLLPTIVLIRSGLELFCLLNILTIYWAFDPILFIASSSVLALVVDRRNPVKVIRQILMQSKRGNTSYRMQVVTLFLYKPGCCLATPAWANTHPKSWLTPWAEDYKGLVCK